MWTWNTKTTGVLVWGNSVLGMTASEMTEKNCWNKCGLERLFQSERKKKAQDTEMVVKHYWWQWIWLCHCSASEDHFVLTCILDVEFSFSQIFSYHLTIQDILHVDGREGMSLSYSVISLLKEKTHGCGLDITLCVLLCTETHFLHFAVWGKWGHARLLRCKEISTPTKWSLETQQNR